jgi:hypothetical protein
LYYPKGYTALNLFIIYSYFAHGKGISFDSGFLSKCGLRYGIPRFNPLTTKNMASTKYKWEQFSEISTEKFLLTNVANNLPKVGGNCA